MTTAEKLRQEGRVEGRMEGRMEGTYMMIRFPGAQCQKAGIV